MPKLSKADKLILAELSKKLRSKRKKWIRFCPHCKSTDIALDARMEMVWYRCKKCFYSAAMFPEKA